MTTLVVSRVQPGAHSGFKAPSDVRQVLGSDGMVLVDRTSRTLALRAKHDARRLGARLRSLSSLDTVVVQYPSGTLPDAMMRKTRGPRLVALVHDLESLRRDEALSPDETRALEHFDVVIAHTPAMADLVDAGTSTDTATVVLGMFDYVVDRPQDRPPDPPARASAPRRLHFVGNLSPTKSAFLHHADSLPRDLTVYGGNFDAALAGRGVAWGGVLGMDDPVLPLDGFGLVWDGSSSQHLGGPLGNYLRYNAPHKFSFYAAAGIPVIVPSDSAIAPMVRELGLGICIDELTAADDVVDGCSSRDYHLMCDAMAGLRRRVTTGWHTRQAVASAARRDA